MHSDEDSVIEQCRNGNSEVYAILVERYQDMIYNVAYRMLGEAETAYDISQESFISAYESLKKFRHGSKFSTWLCSIAINKCRDHLRCRKPDVPLDDVAELLPSRTPDPEKILGQKMLGKALQEALTTLPEDYREAIVLKHVEGLDYNEMEKILGVNVNVLKVRTYRAREMLKKHLLETGVRNG